MRALVLVDLQVDFMPGGALAVPDGDAVIAIANRLQPCFELVVATQDWHPANHGSFASQHEGRAPGDMGELAGIPQVLWPDHCVQDSEGARFHPDLERSRVARVFPKGADREVDSYSGFFDNGRVRSTGLDDYLREQGVDEVYVMGLATDYCVKFTALDAASLGFRTFLVEDACRGVNLKPADSAEAVAEMERAGVTVVRSSELLETKQS